MNDLVLEENRYEEQPELSYYVVIHHNIVCDQNLTDGEKILLGVIIGLCRKKGYCWATNNYLAQSTGKQEITISKAINKMCNLGYLNSEIIYLNKSAKNNVTTKRKITLNEAFIYSQKGKIISDPPDTNVIDPPDTNITRDNIETYNIDNTSINRSIVNDEEVPSTTPKEVVIKKSNNKKDMFDLVNKLIPKESYLDCNKSVTKWLEGVVSNRRVSFDFIDAQLTKLVNFFTIKNNVGTEYEQVVFDPQSVIKVIQYCINEKLYEIYDDVLEEHWKWQ